MGTLEKGIENKEKEILFRNNNVLNKKECKVYWAKYYCSGDCHTNSFFSNGDISKPNQITCEMQKKRIECAIMIETYKIH